MKAWFHLFHFVQAAITGRLKKIICVCVWGGRSFIEDNSNTLRTNLCTENLDVTPWKYLLFQHAFNFVEVQVFCYFQCKICNFASISYFNNCPSQHLVVLQYYREYHLAITFIFDYLCFWISLFVNCEYKGDTKVDAKCHVWYLHFHLRKLVNNLKANDIKKWSKVNDDF